MSEYHPKGDDHDQHDDDYQEEYGPGYKYSGGDYDPRQVSTRDRAYYAQSYGQTEGDAQGDAMPKNPDYDADEDPRYYDDPKRKQEEAEHEEAISRRAAMPENLEEWEEPEHAEHYEYNAYGSDAHDPDQTRVEDPMEFDPSTDRREDGQIYDDVIELFVRDDRLDGDKVHVAVDQGEVVLSGTVKDKPVKVHAEQAVRRVAGVRIVHNALSVPGDEG